VRYRELRGLGVFWRLDGEPELERELKLRNLRGRGKRLMRKGVTKYVRARITGTNSPPRKASISNPERASIGSDSPTSSRYTQPPTRLEDIPSLIIEILDFELLMDELWHDFLIEPTPYLVASAILYLGIVLILAQYYEVVRRLFCFFFHFIPWDDELGLSYV
jgi:hypothetical protein